MKLFVVRLAYFTFLFALCPFLFACVTKGIGPRTVPLGAICQNDKYNAMSLDARVCQSGICENRYCVDHCNGGETGDPANGCAIDRSGMAQVQPQAAPQQAPQPQQGPVGPGTAPAPGPGAPQQGI